MSPPPARVDELKKRYEENPRRFFAPLANEYRKAGDLDAAIDLCRLHLEDQPGHLSGHIVFGQSLFESSRVDEAKTVFEAALTLDPENLIALRHLGDIAKLGGDPTAAGHWYGRVLEADPRNDEVVALIEALGQAPSAVPAEQHEPRPSSAHPDELGLVAAHAVDPHAPTPVIPMAAVPPAPARPAPRLSIGLMDLDLNLADSTAPTVDLLGEAPPARSEVPPVSESLPPAAEEPAPSFDMGLALTDEASSAPEGLDTSFNAPPAAAASTVTTDAAEPSFGDSLDVSASAGFEIDSAPDTGLADRPALADAADLASIGETAMELTSIDETGLEITSVSVDAVVAATPADFDALFGDQPMVGAPVDVEQAPVPVDDVGFVDDSVAAAGDLAAPPSPFVTETMAELYLRQGFREDALNVYRQLLAQNPDDAGLAERVMQLEHGMPSSAAVDAMSGLIASEAVRTSGSIPTVDSEVAPEPLAPLVGAVPAFLVEAPAVGPSARDVLFLIASRRAARGGGVGSGAAALDTAPERASVEPVMPAEEVVATAPAGEVAVAPGGALDRLFEMSGVVAIDEGAAVAMATAFGAAPPMAPIPGEPTRRGSGELSLDSVFGGDEGVARPSIVQRQSATLRFDQFFAAAAEGDAAPAAPPPPAAGDDVAQFSDWLKGLKGT